MAVHVSLAATWHVSWAAAGGTLAHVFSAKRPRQVLETIAGMTLAVLAINLVMR